jgi:ubiquinone/menaquinone biosynthesis C-methylase UbiE
MRDEDTTSKIRRVWDAYASRYDRAMRFTERVWIGPDRRRWVCSRASGEVLEVAVGTGLNLACYPPGVTLTGVDLSPAMLAVARERAAGLGRDIDLREANAEALPFADASFDTVVCTLSLCGVPDNRAAIGEMWRVLRPGGRLLLLDHVGSTWWPVRATQWAVEQITARSAGEYQTRRQLPLVEEAGFSIEETGRRKAGTIEWLAARKPL